MVLFYNILTDEEIVLLSFGAAVVVVPVVEVDVPLLLQQSHNLIS
jgi:hypothetical protein